MLPEDNTLTDRLFELMFSFILLHEYGHFVHGHLSTARLRPAFSGQHPEFQEYSKSQLQEFEADEYAATQMKNRAVDNGIQVSQVATATGLLMKFFGLCEFVYNHGKKTTAERSHPPPEDRWDRIKSIMRIAETGDVIANNMDNAFKAVECGESFTLEAPS